MRSFLIFLGLAATMSIATVAPDAMAGGEVVDLVREVNAVRKEHKLAPVAPNAKLMRAAADHARDMAENDHFDHRGSDGSRLADRLRRVGFDYKLVAENIGGGLDSARDMVRSWMDSADHRKNLLDPQMCRVGVGYIHLPEDGGRVTHKHYWTLVLARPPGPFCPLAAASPSPKAPTAPAAAPRPAAPAAPAGTPAPAR